MILQFPGAAVRRRAVKEESAHALAACRAEFQAIARSATVLATARKKKSPGRGGPEDRGLNRAWAARKRAQ
jgi:hypothetical protein